MTARLVTDVPPYGSPELSCCSCSREFTTLGSLQVHLSWHSRARRSISDRFWEKVARSTPSGCWEWQGHREANGYGRFFAAGMVWAHRVAYTLARGPIPPGMWVLHHCDNPPCCNPAHLWLGTRTDNVRDAQAKGRLRWTSAHAFRLDPARQVRGERHPAARLTAGQVDLVRARVSKGEAQAAVARSLGVSPMTVNDIVRGRTWRHGS